MTKDNKNLSELLEFSLHKFDEQYQFYKSFTDQFDSYSKIVESQERSEEILKRTIKGVGLLVTAHNNSIEHYRSNFKEILEETSAIRESLEIIKTELSTRNEIKEEPEIIEESSHRDRYGILKMAGVIGIVLLLFYTHYELGVERQNNLIRKDLFPAEMDSVNTILQNNVLRKEMLDSLDGL